MNVLFFNNFKLDTDSTDSNSDVNNTSLLQIVYLYLELSETCSIKKISYFYYDFDKKFDGRNI